MTNPAPPAADDIETKADQIEEHAEQMERHDRAIPLPDEEEEEGVGPTTGLVP